MEALISHGIRKTVGAPRDPAARSLWGLRTMKYRERHSDGPVASRVVLLA